jgi:heme exporter protein C
MNKFLLWFHTTGSPPNFERFALRWAMPSFMLALVCFAIGIYGALYVVPTDINQGEVFRILYIHVPCAWMSLFVFGAMSVQAFIALVWRIKLCEILIIASAHIGALFTLITWWTWDARLTSELVLLFIYLGIIGLYNAIEDRRAAARAAAFLALIGIVNVPIVHFSVTWWNTLHQGTTIRLMGESKMAPEMLWPLIFVTIATKFWFIGSLLQRARAMNIQNESNTDWAKQIAGAN